MKKKNIIKKLLSVVLSAATVFSLLTLPAHAIVPGEDSYTGQEDGYIRIDVETQTREFIPKSDVPNFTGESTYDVLNPIDKARMEAINQEIIAEYEQGVELLDVTDGDYTYVSPVTDRYSGIVILGIFSDSTYDNCIGWGTGFMLNEDTLLTALHNFYDFMKNDITQFNMLSYNPYVRVYYDIERDFFSDSTDDPRIAARNHLRDSNKYVTIDSVIFSSAIDGTDCDDREYDWAIGKLATPLSNVEYFWDCTVFKNTMQGKTSKAVGYPGSHALKMIETSGTIFDADPNTKLIYLTNSSDSGMSGGPLYITTLTGIKCCGILAQYSDTFQTMLGVEIFDDLLDVIVSCMEE